MTASLSGVFSLQEFSDIGAPLVGGRLYTYVYGTTTHKTAYTDKAGTIPHTYTSDGIGGQYIALNARGELPAPLYLAAGSYDITLKDSTGATIWTRRADPVDDSAAALDSAIRSDLASTSDASKGTGMGGHGADLNYVAGTIGATLNDVCLNVKMFPWLAKGDGVTNDYPAISAAIAYVQSIGGGVVVIPGGKTYNCAGNVISITGANVTLSGYSATLLNTRISISSTATDTNVIGLKVLDNTASNSTYLLDLAGTRFNVVDVTIEKSPVAGGVIAYIRRQSSFGTFRNLRTFGSNGIFISGHDHSFIGCHLESKGVTPGAGTDDAYVIKAGDSSGATVETYNISIVGGSVRGFFNILAIGSEVGRYAADGDYSSFVRNVTVDGVTAYRCVTLAYIKPGALGPDYRHGLVENVNINNCTLIDDNQGYIYWGVNISAGRGAIIRSVNISDCTIRGRCDGTSVTHAGVYISGANVGASATIEDVTIDNVQVFDTYDGVANDGSHPGQPFYWGAYISRTSAANDTIRRIKLRDSRFRGTKNGGIGIENSPQGPIDIVDVDLLETGINPSAGSFRGVFGLTSATESSIRNLTVNTSSGQLAAGATDFSTSSEVAIVDLGSAAAGTNISHMFWVAPRDCYIWKIELADSAGIVQSDADYIQFDIRNKNTGSDLPAFTTKVTGGYALPAFTPVAMSPTSYTTAEAYLPKGKALQVITTNTGAGKALTAIKGVIYYVTYGR